MKAAKTRGRKEMQARRELKEPGKENRMLLGNMK